MARVIVELPPSFLFSFELPLRHVDMNDAGHLGNERILMFAQETRKRWLAGHGLKELDLGGAGLIVADAAIVYVAEAHAGDVLRCELGVGEVKNRSAELLYRFTEVASGREIARAKTAVLCFDYATRTVVPLTQGLKLAIAR
jgi:acyl-CoA thioesterase FadM